MLNRIVIGGFRSLSSLDLNLGPITVLIGPNNSGKSNFVDALQLIAEAARGELTNGFLRRGGFHGLAWAGGIGSPNILWGTNVSLTRENAQWSFAFGAVVNPALGGVTVSHEQVETPDGSLVGTTAEVIIDNKGPNVERPVLDRTELALSQIRFPSRYPWLETVRQYLSSWTFYRDFNTGLEPEAPIRQPQVARATTRLSPHGDNLATVLYYMSQRPQYRDAYDEIVTTIRLAYPDLKELYFPAEEGDGKIGLRWLEKHFRRDFSASQLSDGTLRFLCLITALMAPDPPGLICIDEPELGVHPALLKLLAGAIKIAGDRTQVIIITHSPQLVSYFAPDQVAVAERVDGATVVRRLDSEPDLEQWLKDFSLGDLWLRGQLGGRP